MQSDFSSPATLETLEFLGFYLDGSAWVHDHGESKTFIEHDDDSSAPEFLASGPVIMWTQSDTDFADGIEAEIRTFPTLAHALMEFYGPIEGAELPSELFVVTAIVDHI